MRMLQCVDGIRRPEVMRIEALSFLGEAERLFE